MFSQKDTIHFGCTQCGKCCQKSPNMSFYDMIMLSDEFIFQTAHHAAISYEKLLLDKHLIDHYRVLGHTIMLPELDASLFYFIDFTTMSYPSYKTCSKLVNNQCSIYGKRPGTCKMAPIDYRFDDTQQWRAIQYYKDNTEKNGWKCAFDNEQPIVFANEQIQQTGMNSQYFQNVEAVRDFTDKYIEFLGMGQGKHQENHFKAVFASINRNQLMITDMIIPLQVARMHGILSESQTIEFIEKQIKLIDNEIDMAKQNKRKEDLQFTRLYKKQKEDYLRAMNANIFKEYDDVRL